MKKVLLIMLLSVTLFASMFEDNKKACDGGEMGSCTNLGSMYSTGDGVRQDKVKELFEKACNDGDVDGCKEYKTLSG